MPLNGEFALKKGVRASLYCESIHITSIISYFIVEREAWGLSSSLYSRGLICLGGAVLLTLGIKSTLYEHYKDTT